MICKTSKELLSEIKKYMDLNSIQMKELAVMMNKSQQSISQIFQVNNPKCDTLFQICNALGIEMDIKFIQKSDT